MIKSKRLIELDKLISQLDAERNSLIHQHCQLSISVRGKVDKILSKKFGVNCCGLASFLARKTGYYVGDLWENSVDAPELRLICDEYFGGEEHTGEHIKQLISKGVLIEKFYWMDEVCDDNFLDNDLQTHMKNVITLAEYGVDNFPDSVEDYEKYPFNPILGESCSLEEMKDGMIPIWYATQEFLDAIKEAEQILVDTGEFEYV